MKKFLSIFAAMLIAVAVFADPVVLPATLDVNNVGFRSDNLPDFVLTEGDFAGTYFDMGAHDNAGDTLLYAEWDVTIEAINYYLTAVVYNTNSWRVQIDLLNQNDEVVKALRYKGSSGQCGQYAIGSIDMSDLEPGNYKLRARSAYAWSALKLRDIIFEADYSGVSVALPGTLEPAYAELSANASITNHAIAFKPSTAPNEYANWNVSFAEAGTYNVTIDITASNGHNYGVELISEDGETSYGAVNEGGQHGDTGVKELGAITVPAAGNYIVHLTNSIVWSEAVLNSITIAAPAPVLPWVGIIGDMNAWGNPEATTLNPDEGGETASITIHLEQNANSGYGFKILVGSRSLCIAPDEHGWYGFHRGHTHADNIDHDATADEAFWLQIDKVGDYTFTWTYATNSLDITFPALDHENGFYLAGTFGGEAHWSADAITADKMFTWNSKTGVSDNDEWILTMTVAAGDEFKACYIYNDVIESYNWFPGGSDPNFVVSAELAGRVNIYLRPAKDGGEGWWYNTLYVEKAEGTAINNVEAEMKAVKMVENGQLIIIKNGVKYNVLGATL